MLFLFRWWRSWQARRRRNLFEFFDGKRFRRADPWPIYRQLYADDEFVIGKDKDDPADMLEAALRLEEPEFSKCVRCGHRALGTKPVDPLTGEGLSETEVVSTVYDFLLWCEALLKKNVGSPISSAPTASIFSAGQDSPENRTSSPSSSSSQPTESTPDAALSSSTV